jgi:glutaredoxin
MDVARLAPVDGREGARLRRDVKEFAMRMLRNTLSTIVLVAIAAACGWFGALAIRTLNAAPAMQTGDFSAIVATAGRPVVLFATTTCPYCARARSLLDAMKVDHVVYDIDTSEPARALYGQLHANSVPVLVTAGLRITGFDESAYRTKLGTLARQ